MQYLTVEENEFYQKLLIIPSKLKQIETDFTYH